MDDHRIASIASHLFHDSVFTHFFPNRILLARYEPRHCSNQFRSLKLFVKFIRTPDRLWICVHVLRLDAVKFTQHQVHELRQHSRIRFKTLPTPSRSGARKYPQKQSLEGLRRWRSQAPFFVILSVFHTAGAKLLNRLQFINKRRYYIASVL